MADEKAKWQSKIDALVRLAEDQRGKPEGELARQKLARVLRRFPQVREYEPVQEFMLKDLSYMRRNQISMEGSWTGGNFAQAIAMMTADYRNRIIAHKAPRLGGKSG